MSNFMSFRSILAAGAVVSGLLFLFSGCDKSTDPTAGSILDEDAAISIAGAISDDGGGASDQISDAASLAGSGGLRAEVNLHNAGYGVASGAAVDTSYDEATGWWTAVVTRSRTSLSGNYASYIYRVYQYQFLNAGAQVQRTYIAGSDTAYTIKFKILRGLGYHRTPWRVHRLDSLSGDWTVTNAQLPVVTINGTYYRAGVDTLNTRNAQRTHANTLTAQFIDVQKARPTMSGMSDAVSGTITGTYTAKVTFIRGDLYSERNITKTFTIDLSSTDEEIMMGERRFHFGRMYGQLN